MDNSTAGLTVERMVLLKEAKSVETTEMKQVVKLVVKMVDSKDQMKGVRMAEMKVEAKDAS